MRNPASLRFFRLLLKLYPREFRDEYGARMEDAFLAALARQICRRGRAGVLLSWVRVSWDTLFHAADLRLEPWLRGRRGSQPGLPRPNDGKASARLRFGSAVSNTLLDLRVTLRSLRRSLNFTVLTVAVAVLGITLSTLVFTAVNAAFLRPPPHVTKPDQLVKVFRELPSRPGRRYRLAYQDYRHLQEESAALYDLVGVIPSVEFMFRTGSELDRSVVGAEVTENYFQALGIPTVIGRGILAEDAGSSEGVAVLGYATWMRVFGGGGAALGQTIRLDGKAYTVVGVAPPGLGWLSSEPLEAAVWIPVRPRYRETGEQNDWNVLTVAGRRRDHVTLQQAQAELDALASGLVASDRHRWTEDHGEPIGLGVLTERQARLDPGGPRGLASVIIYFVLVGIIMLITCSNVATLLLNRALKRRSEIAMRLTMGASRGRLVRQLLGESVLLFSLAGALALLLIHWATQLLAAGWSSALPAAADITVDGRVTAFTLGLTALSGLVFGMIPALQSTKPDLAPALKGTGPGQASGRLGARDLFTVAQVTGSMVLVAVAALLVRDVRRAASMDLGFNPNGVVVASLDLSHGDYDEDGGRLWVETLMERLKGLPDVEDVAATNWVPLSGSVWSQLIVPEGVEIGPDEDLFALYNTATPGYFRLVDMPLVAGREFRTSDDAEAPPVVVVNQAFARRYWPGQPPIGKSVGLGNEGPAARVVGVVGDAMYSFADIRNAEASPHIWVPRGQVHHDPLQVHVRTRGAEGPVLAAMRREIRLLDDDLPIMELTTMESITGNALRGMRVAAAISGVFGALALFLASLGIYGFMAHSVMDRTREFGVRLAVGAGPRRVVGKVLVDALRLSALGIGLGLGLAVLVSMGIRTLLVGVSPLDPFSLSGSMMVLALAALSAALIPAVRAARLDPVASLRSD